MPSTTIIKGNARYNVDAQEHLRNTRKLKQLPEMLDKIGKLSERFVGKPQYVVQQKGCLVSVLREDLRPVLRELIRMPEDRYGKALSTSEWRLDTDYRGSEEFLSLPLTMHDVYVEGKITIKTGNPYRNNAFEEFYRALHARSLGIVEAKSPLGFSFYTDDLYGIKKPGKMFYRHIKGRDLGQCVQTEGRDFLNWALWEAGKFFSRLLNAHLYLEDSDRLGNYFIEDNASSGVFRFLDLERVYYMAAYSNKKKAEMLGKFIQRALEQGLLTPERMGEFVIVSLGASSKANQLVDELLALSL